MGSSRQRVRVEAPAEMDRLDLVDALSGDEVLSKAQRKYNTRTFRRERAMDELSKQIEDAYSATLDKMFKELLKYIGTKIVPGTKLSKASDDDEGMYGFAADVSWPDDGMVAFASAQDPSDSAFSNARFMAEQKMSLLTPAQLETVKRIIRDYHYAFAVGTFGPDVIPPAEVQRLIDTGVLPQDLAYVFNPGPNERPPDAMRVTDLAYQYGQQLAKPKQKEAVRDMGMDAFLEHLENTRKTLSPVDRQAMAYARYNGGQHIQGMADRFVLETGTLIRNADAEQRRRYMGTVQRELENNIDKRETWRKLASEIGHATEDWSRDMRRLAATEKQFAMQEGQAREIGKKYDDPDDARVAKIPAPDACPDCVRLHLTAGVGSPPRIFKLSELLANGTNVGRKRQSWKATVGPTHPWCFPAGTQVQIGFMGRTRAIEDLLPGELVVTHANRLRAVQRLSQRAFRGELVVLTIGRQTLELTPEHPLLTSRGWLAAERIEVGDDLLQIHEPSPTHAQAKNGPSDDREERFLAGVLRTLAAAGVPVGVNLDDSPQLGEAEVGAVGANRELWRALVAGLEQRVRSELLELGEYRILLACLRRLDLLPYRARLSAYSGVCCLREALSVFRATATCDDPALVRDGSDRHSCFDQATRDRAARCFEAFSQLFDAVAALVRSNDLLDGEVEPFGHDVAYHAAPVTSIERRSFEGSVFNFSVEEDESYVAGGFVAHNCGCEVQEVPDGWAFNEDGEMVPESMLKKGDRLDVSWSELRKAHMTYRESVPRDELVVRVADPQIRQVIEAVVQQAPPQIFHADIGITLITTDMPRPQNPLDDHDYAYWTANEIRLNQTLPVERIPRVLRHEIGHSLNVYLMRKFGSTQAVRDWHDELWALSKEEGFVSSYARKLPIENAAEVTRMYLFERAKLMVRFPQTFAFVHRFYKPIFEA